MLCDHQCHPERKYFVYKLFSNQKLFKQLKLANARHETVAYASRVPSEIRI